MLEDFTVQTFSEHLGDTFRVYTEASEPLDLELTSATELGTNPGSGSDGLRQPFSILFCGPGDVLIPQGTYRTEHPDVGSFDLFLVPLGPDEEGLLYEAIFA